MQAIKTLNSKIEQLLKAETDVFKQLFTLLLGRLLTEAMKALQLNLPFPTLHF
jgi:hypothetical protein